MEEKGDGGATSTSSTKQQQPPSKPELLSSDPSSETDDQQRQKKKNRSFTNENRRGSVLQRRSDLHSHHKKTGLKANSIELCSSMKAYHRKRDSNMSTDNSGSSSLFSVNHSKGRSSNLSSIAAKNSVEEEENEEAGEGETKHNENQNQHPAEEWTDLQTMEMTAFVHLLEWAESADRIKTIMAKEDEELLNNMHGCSRTLVGCCCPNFLCCNNDRFFEQPASPSLLSKQYVFARHTEADYRCCGCLRNVGLNLFTAPFIWYKLPLGVIKNRGVMVFQTIMQLLTIIFQWTFLIELIEAETDYQTKKAADEDYDIVRIPSTVVWFTATVFVLPEIFHVVYLLFTPGYNVRSCRRNCKQVCFTTGSMFGVRPVYECLSSMKFMQMMPYVFAMQNEGHIVSDTGVHERFLIWQGLATTLREIPLRIAQFYVLSEIWVFWNVVARDDSSGEYSTDVTKQIGSLLNSQTCVNIRTNVNASTVILGCFVGLIVSAFTLSDLLEREIPHGAYPRRFSRVLSGDLCTSPALFWMLTFIIALFIDLVLKLLVLMPLMVLKSPAWMIVMIVIFLLQSILLCRFLMTEGQDTSTLISTESFKRTEKLRRQSSDGQLSTLSAVAAPDRIKRSFADSYDDGFVLDSIERVKAHSNCCNTAAETMPFVFWGAWVDLPVRLKWLRLRHGENDSKNWVCQRCGCKLNVPKSLAYYLISSGSTIVVVVAIFLFNLYTVNEQWSNGPRVECNKAILEVNVADGGCNLTHVPCPMNMTHEYMHVMRYSADLTPEKSNSTWLLGCNRLRDFGNRTILCLPEVMLRDDVRIIAKNFKSTSAEMFRYMFSSHQAGSLYFQFFFLFVVLKISIATLVTKQFYCAAKENRGSICCCRGMTEEKKTKQSKEEKKEAWKKKRSSATNTVWSLISFEERSNRRNQHNEDLDNWHSHLRARDIQLCLRMSRLTSPKDQMALVSENTIDDIEVAKAVLGRGGIVDDVVVKELNQALKEELEAANKGSGIRRIRSVATISVTNPFFQQEKKKRRGSLRRNSGKERSGE